MQHHTAHRDAFKILKLFNISAFVMMLAIATSSITGYGLRGGLVLLPTVMICASIGLFILLNPALLKRSFLPHEYASVAFIVLTGIAAFLQPNEKTVPYILVYAVTFLGFTFFLRCAMRGVSNWPLVYKVNMWAVLFFCALCVVEFVIRGFFRFEINEHLPRIIRGVATCALFIPRTYALAIEPTYLGWYFNTLGLLGLSHLWTDSGFSYGKKVALTVLFVVAYFLTFAIAPGGSLLIGVAITFAYLLVTGLGDGFARAKAMLIHVKNHGGTAVLCIAIGLSVYVAAIWFAGGAENVQSCMGRGAEKAQLTLKTTESKVIVPDGVSFPVTDPPITSAPAVVPSISSPSGQADNAPAPAPTITPPPATIPAVAPSTPPVARIKLDKGRSEIWAEDLVQSKEKPHWGWGPGYKSSQNKFSSMNLWLFVWLEQGIYAAMACFVVFILAYRQIDLTGRPDRTIIMIGFAAGTFQLMTMTQHYYTNLWLLLAIGLTPAWGVATHDHHQAITPDKAETF